VLFALRTFHLALGMYAHRGLFYMPLLQLAITTNRAWLMPLALALSAHQFRFAICELFTILDFQFGNWSTTPTGSCCQQLATDSNWHLAAGRYRATAALLRAGSCQLLPAAAAAAHCALLLHDVVLLSTGGKV
jgi:hypothetical protein